MEIKPPADRMKEAWMKLYPDYETDQLDNFIREVDKVRSEVALPPQEPDWYKDAVVYSMYVDLFNNDFKGLAEKLEYLEGLGVNCLWLLPILDSPMKDAGFDISDYRNIRPALLNLPDDSTQKEREDAFGVFLQQAAKKKIKVIFDIAINHTSDQHHWFREARKSPDNPYRDYYIWSQDTALYKDARIIFEGLCESNWEKDGDWYFFHRFFEFQPDLNYRNPEVLLEMSCNMLYWLKFGVDGFRADAIPYLWKEDGTTCENLPQTHTVVQFIRAVLDYIRPNTLLLAEACQKPKEVVKYFGQGNECHAGYHFPLMPQMFKALSKQSKEPVIKVLSPDVTPEIPEGSQWFTFLRCHDELSLELVYVTEEDRRYIHDNYCKVPEWDFRKGQGISARLADLLNNDPRKIGLAYSMMLSLPGTPVIYYGDEFGKTNDEAYYREMIKLTGKDDTRFLVRGKIDWDYLEQELKNRESYSWKVYDQISNMINIRKQHSSFGKGDIQYIDVQDDKNKMLNEVFAYYRSHGHEQILVINNLCEKDIVIKMPSHKLTKLKKDILGHSIKINKQDETILLPSLSYYWILV